MEDNRFQDHTENICFFYEMLKKLDGIPSAFVSNADESGSQDWVNKIGGITYVPKGYENEKYPMKRTGARSTLMACVNLDGTTLQPYYIVSRETVDSELLDNGITGQKIRLAHSDNGFINMNLFNDWFDEVYLKEIKARREKYNYYGYALLLLDGCTCHYTREVMQNAIKNKIIIAIIPPHTSHLIQCLDVGVFGVHKRAMSMYSNDDDVTYQTNQNLKNYNCWQKVTTNSNIISAFEAVGICTKSVIENDKRFNVMKVDIKSVRDKKTRNDLMEHEFNCLRLPPLDTDMVNNDKKKTTMSIAYFNSTI